MSLFTDESFSCNQLQLNRTLNCAHSLTLQDYHQAIFICTKDSFVRISFRKIFDACWRESVKPLLLYCNTMPASLLVEKRKMIFYDKILHSDNIVLRIFCALHRNEAQKLSSVYHIFPGHSSSCLLYTSDAADE